MITMADLARAFGVSRPTILRDVRNGCPLSSVSDALAWRAGRGMKVPPNMRHQEPKARKRVEQIAGEPDPTLKDEGLDGFHARLIQAEVAAFQRLENARACGDDAQIANALRMYNSAATGRQEVEERVIKAQVQDGNLVPVEGARDIIRGIMEPLRVQLLSMPASLCARCNPGDPELARMQIEQGIVGLLRIVEENAKAKNG
jgi:hypothetical protein